MVGLGHDLLLNFKAQKDKLMNEELVLMSSKDPSSKVKLILHARVLGNLSTLPFFCHQRVLKFSSRAAKSRK